jgi:hypothetical protein
MSLFLSARDLQHLRTAQRVLLAPLQYDTPEAWQRDATRHVKTVMGTDHAYAFMPPEHGLTLVGSALDPAFVEGLRASVRGVQDGPFLLDISMPRQTGISTRPRSFHARIARFGLSLPSQNENAPVLPGAERGRFSGQ